MKIRQLEKGAQVTIRGSGEAAVDSAPSDGKNLAPRQFGTLKDRITILDPDWVKPQDDLERWLKGDV